MCQLGRKVMFLVLQPILNLFLMSFFFTGSNIVKRLREKLFSSVMRQEMGFFDKTRTGELVNRLSADTTLVGQSVSVNVSDGLRSVAQAIGGVGMMVSHKCMNYG